MASTTILQRGSVFAIKREVTSGSYVAPTSGADFIPLKSGFSMEFTVEELVSDELVNDIGSAKSLGGKESATGTHGAYFKHSEVEGQEPEVGLLYESSLGGKTVNATEYDTTAGSTTTVLNVGVGEGSLFEVGQALLIKDSVNGFSIRNIKSISSDALTLDFALTVAPLSGVNLGKAILYKPAASGHPSYTAWLYNGNGGAIQVAAGARTSGITLSASSGGQAEIEFTYSGAKYFFDPIEILSTDRYLDFTDDDGTWAVLIKVGLYASPIEVAEALAAAMNSSGTTETHSVSYSSSNGKFTISSSTSAVLSLLWSSGANTANTVGDKIGFVVASNDTGATSYTSDNAQVLTAPYTPTFDGSTNLIAKNVELFLGDQSDNLCVCAQEVAITISTPAEDVDCICEESGVKEKIILSREVTMTTTLLLSKFDVKIFDKLKQNKSLSAMLNLGPKSGGNWVPGKCGNIYLSNATVTQHNISGDDIVVVEVAIKGYVTSTLKDVYVNFV